MKKSAYIFKGNASYIVILIVCVILLVVFVAIATTSGAWPGSDASAQILSALAGAVVAAIITMFLLLGQTSSEEKKERNTKVFEEKLKIYQDFLHKLCDVVKDMKIEPQEEIELAFQVSYIAMHTKSDSIKNISEQVKEIVLSVKEKRENEEILNQLLSISDTFHEELYLIKYDADERTRDLIISNFRSIFVPKDGIKQYEEDINNSIIASLNGKSLNLEDRATLLKAMINPNGSKQWIFQKNCLVHEYWTDISEKTGNYQYGNNRIAIDLAPEKDGYVLKLFTRAKSEEKTKELVEGIWGPGSFNPYPDQKWRHVVKKIPYSMNNDEIAAIMSQLLEKVKNYRDSTYKTKTNK